MNTNINKFALNLQLFNNINLTTSATVGNDLSMEMKTYYSDYLIDNAKPLLVHDQFAQKHPIPKNGGKTIEFRKYSPFAKALTPITEGVTPAGTPMDGSTITAEINQYGAYVELSDVLLLTAIDNNLVEATKLLGNQAGETLDTITREVIVGGTNVQYAGGVSARSALGADNKLTVEECFKAARFLKTQKAKKISGYYVAIIHPDVAYDLMRCDEWIHASQYAGGVGDRSALAADNKLTVEECFKAARFLKTQKAKKIDGYYVAIIHPDVAYDLMRSEDWVNAVQYAGSSQLFEGEIGRVAGIRFVETTEAKIFEKAGAGSKDVYATLVLGADAYGITEVEGGGLQHIVKQLGSAGTADPLNQRATVGWKAIKTAERLVEGYMVRIESCSTFDSGAN